MTLLLIHAVNVLKFQNLSLIAIAFLFVNNQKI